MSDRDELLLRGAVAAAGGQRLRRRHWRRSRPARSGSSALEGAGELSRRGTAPVFRGDEDASQPVAPHLDLLGEALAAPGGGERDEVDDLFLGGR